MNRKRQSKVEKQRVKALNSLHPFDDPENWARGDFAVPPWPKEKIAEFQKRINSAFGAENAIVLVWTGDRSYGDEFYDAPWDAFGNPLGKLSRKPVILFGEVPVNETDVFYISPARWCLMEAHHGSQLEDSWEDSAWISDDQFIGGRKRIRRKTPPEFYYVHLHNGVLANHERPLITGDVPPCCRRLWDNGKRICYGTYREPNDSDIAMIRQIRERMDAAGVSQRADAPRDAKSVMAANLATKNFVQHAKFQRASAAKNLMLSNVSAFCGDILTKTGSTMSNAEMERIVEKALDQDEYERFSKE